MLVLPLHNCICPNSIFPNFIFPTCIFPNCIFPTCIIPNSIYQNCIFRSVLRIFWALRVYYEREVVGSSSRLQATVLSTTRWPPEEFKITFVLHLAFSSATSPPFSYMHIHQINLKMCRIGEEYTSVPALCVNWTLDSVCVTSDLMRLIVSEKVIVPYTLINISYVALFLRENNHDDSLEGEKSVWGDSQMKMARNGWNLRRKTSG